MKKLIKKYKSLNIAAKAGIWFVVCSCLQSGIKFISLPIFANIMSLDEYGIATLYTTWMSIIYIFATLSLGKANGVFYVAMVKYPKDKDKFTTSMCGLTILLCFISMLLLILSTILFGDWIKIGIVNYYALFFELVGFGIMLLWSLRSRYEYNYKSLIAVTFIYSFGTIIVPVICVFLLGKFFPTSLIKIWSEAIFAFIIGLILFINLLKKNKKIYDKFFWKYAFKFNVVLIPHYLSNVILSQSDRVMIAELISKAAAAIYNVAYTLGVASQVFTQALINAINPWMYKKIADGKEQSVKKVVVPLVFVISLIIILLVSVMPEIFVILFPKTYNEALNVIPPVAAGVLWAFIFNLYSSLELYYSGNKLVSIASFTGAAINIILNLIFIPKFGFVAAAYTTLICDIIYAFMHTLFSKILQRKNGNRSNILPIITIWAIGIFTTILCIIILMLYQKFIIRYVLVFVITLLMLVNYKKIMNLFKFKKMS